MYRNNKGVIGDKSKDIGRVSGISIRDRVRSQVFRLKSKKKQYYIQKSLEPDDIGLYLVVYRSETSNGSGEGRVYKGTYKKCQEKIKELRKDNDYGI